MGARGLTGPGYGGHVFWDADVFVLPRTGGDAPGRGPGHARIPDPPTPRRPGASSASRRARLAWGALSVGVGVAGNDVTPTEAVDGRGEVVTIRTGEMEEHITADVAWAAWQLAAWTGDLEFLEGAGRPLLIETARYWAGQVRLDPAGVGHIDGVIGPDEYHENVDDNAFTNQMAAWNMNRAGPTS